MTLDILDEDWQLQGLDGTSYKVGPRCANPSCIRNAEHAHHMVRRTKYGKPYNWIRLPDDTIRGNLVGLCPYCHEMVTGPIGGHQAAIRFEDGVFYWCDVEEQDGRIDYLPIAPIDPQPPTPEIAAVASKAETESENCPTCGQRRRRSATGTMERRRRTTWTMDVPDDHEQGAEILDTLADDLAIKLGFANERSRLRRYHAVWHALVFTQQHMKLFAQDLAGRG